MTWEPVQIYLALCERGRNSLFYNLLNQKITEMKPV